jgi:hypothetical protein
VLGRTEENHSEDSWYSSWDLNQALPKYKSQTSALHTTADFCKKGKHVNIQFLNKELCLTAEVPSSWF